MKNWLLSLIILCLSAPLQAANTAIEGLRVWSAPDHSRLVFDTSAPVQHTIFSLKSPDRLVIDLQNATLTGKLAVPDAADHVIAGLRYAPREKNNLRIVLDLKGEVRPKSFVLKPGGQYGHRLVIDLEPKSQKADKPQITKSAPDTKSGGLRDVVIAIDAGHGGDDPGAIGKHGTREKDVMLALARQLSAKINAEPGMKAYLTRQGDYYVPLRKRMQLARKQRADLFVSLHADAFKDRRVRGSSVYVLSSRGASNEAARWLAERENASDLVGGVTLEDKDDVLASVLLDLSQTATREASLDAAGDVHRQLGRVGKTHGRRVLKAGFVVLKSPDVPSMLIETAFISNPQEERNLRSAAFRERMAGAILQGVRDYFQQAAPPGTRIAANRPKQHVISRGDTLSGIAQQYQVSMTRLRQSNGLRGDRLRIGQVLRIPGG